MAGFYRLISEGAREDGYASRSAKSLIPRLLGDKDHEKVFNVVAKVDLSRVSSSYFFLFFEPIPIFSHF